MDIIRQLPKETSPMRAIRTVVSALDDDLRRETVSVQSPTFVILRQMRQQVGGFELKCFSEFHDSVMRFRGQSSG